MASTHANQTGKQLLPEKHRAARKLKKKVERLHLCSGCYHCLRKFDAIGFQRTQHTRELNSLIWLELGPGRIKPGDIRISSCVPKSYYLGTSKYRAQYASTRYLQGFQNEVPCQVTISVIAKFKTVLEEMTGKKGALTTASNYLHLCPPKLSLRPQTFPQHTLSNVPRVEHPSESALYDSRILQTSWYVARQSN